MTHAMRCLILLSLTLAAGANAAAQTTEELLAKKSDYKLFVTAGKLAVTDDAARNALVVALRQHSDEVHRSWAAILLGENKVALAADALAQSAITDKNAGTRKSAAEALRQIGTPGAVAALGTVLQQGDEATQQIAAEQLGRINSDTALSVLSARAANSETARQVLELYDTRGKPSMAYKEMQVTFIGVTRTSQWTDSFRRTYAAKKGYELVVVSFRLAASGPQPGQVLFVDAVDASGNKLPSAEGFSLTTVTLRPEFENRYFGRKVFIAPVGTKLSRVVILDAEFPAS